MDKSSPKLWRVGADINTTKSILETFANKESAEKRANELQRKYPSAFILVSKISNLSSSKRSKA